MISGPSHWPQMFFTCSGSRQSPINIETGSVKREYWRPFVFKHYDSVPTRMRIKNNGHSAQVEIDAPNAPRVGEGGLKDDYIFAQFHFHWGSDSTRGSEHTIDGVRYPLELHLVHYKASAGSLAEAVKHPDGLTVLGVLFEISDKDNAAFTPLVGALENIKIAGRVSDVPANYPLSAFLPNDKDNFFRYEGSLTTPTCNEVVIWTMFRQPLAAFRQLLGDDGHHHIMDNYRPPQQIRSRKVFVNAASSAEDATSMKKLGLALYFMSTMAVLMMNM
ncbi:Carbonic anhydrase 2 [Armadillidium vulgare]|nr:Carbonic anhydrase 2 [Armadillidium vulgare]